MTQICSKCAAVTDTYHEVGIKRIEYGKKSYAAHRIICHRCFSPVDLYDILMNPIETLKKEKENQD